MESLTTEQIANLLTIVSGSTDLNIYMEKFEKIDPDMAMTVKKILNLDQDSSGRGKTGRLASLNIDSYRRVHEYQSFSRNGNESFKWGYEKTSSDTTPINRFKIPLTMFEFSFDNLFNAK